MKNRIIWLHYGNTIDYIPIPGEASVDDLINEISQRHSISSNEFELYRNNGESLDGKMLVSQVSLNGTISLILKRKDTHGFVIFFLI